VQNKVSTLVGTTLGTCVLERLVGAGGMSIVFLAQQLHPAREVAVKILQPDMQVPEEEHLQFLTRFRREADVVAQLDHVNILPIYEYGEQDERAYLVMPYLTGGSLDDLLKSHGTFSPQETLAYMQQIAAALDYAHLHGIVHRDIKPGNMLLHADGRLVLADFGIAHILHDEYVTHETVKTSSGLFLGSVDYMAPEMIQGQPIDARADIYELGVVIFQLLCGQVPFQGNSPFVIAAKHVQEPPPYMDEINAALSKEMDGVVRKALAKLPEDRYQSAGELVQALRDAIFMTQNATWKRGIPSTTLPTLPTMVVQKEVQAQNDDNFLHRSVSTEVRKESSHVSSSHRGTRKGRLIALALVFLLLSGGFLVSQQILRGRWMGATPHSSGVSRSTQTGASSPTVSPAQTPTRSQQAQAIVQHYYDDINQANYQDAYKQWGSDYQKSLSYPQFSTGFSTTTHDDIVLHATHAQNDGTMVVEITLYATQETSSGTRIDAFEGHYIVGQENGVWKLLRADLQPIGASFPTATPSRDDQAQAEFVVQHYYQAINASDYHTAYQLWGAEYQGSHTYTQFATGFRATKQDAVTITPATPLATNVYRIGITIKTTERDKAGTIVNTYSGSYVVGQENGNWKLLTADLRKLS